MKKLTDAQLLARYNEKNPFPRIHSKSQRSGTVTYYVDLRGTDAIPAQPSFRTLDEALTRAELARLARQNEGTAAFTISDALRVAAVRSETKLKPYNATLDDAVSYYIKHFLSYRTAPPIKDVVASLIAESKAMNNRPRTINDLEHRLNHSFVNSFGEKRLHELTVADLTEWLTDEDWAPRTRINSHTKISQLFNHAIMKGWAETNITERIPRPRVEAPEPVIFAVDECKCLLSHAPQFNLLPYVALGLFAGIRTAELERLDGSAINFETKKITIGASVAKKRGRRVIDMQDALIAFLEPMKNELKTARIIPPTFREDRESLVKSCGMDEWKANGLRHSFGTYHFAMWNNEGLTAQQMGNSPDMMHKHYKGLVGKEVAESFWNIRPAA